MEYVDATGLVCPKPVIMAKKALKESNEITIDVDNEMSCENLQKMAKVMDLSCQVSKEGSVFRLVMVKNKHTERAEISSGENNGVVGDSGTAREAGAWKGGAAGKSDDSYIVVFSSRFVGQGDDTLGAALMKSFIYTLTEAEVLPECMIFYNGGVWLTTEGSPVLEDMQKLEEAGVEILSCGTCLNFYGLEQKLKVGQVTNMYVIVEKQRKAFRIIRP